MEALMATYATDSESGDDGESLSPPPATSTAKPTEGGEFSLPPPPRDLLDLPPHHAFGIKNQGRIAMKLRKELHSKFTSCTTFRPHRSQTTQGSRIRSFPHIEGNYALHIFMPVSIPSTARKMITSFVKRISSLVSGLHVVDADIPLGDLCKEDRMTEKHFLEKEFHVSLGRTVPIKVHQIDSIVSMLRQKFVSQKGNRYLIDFNRWEVFVNDDLTRSFLSMEVTGGGLPQIIKQIQIVNSVYRLHGLPEFYENPRPHISLLWALGDVSHTLNRAVEEMNKVQCRLGSTGGCFFQCQFGGIECKIGKKSYKVC